MRYKDRVTLAEPRMKVCIIQPAMKAYRIPFFLGLQQALAQDGIGLEVVYDRPASEAAGRGDDVSLAPPLGREVVSWRLAGRLFVQPVLRPWLHADLVIVEHANRHALNYLLMLLSALRLKRLAYWGHGFNHQADPRSLTERFKRWTVRRADWWFAYTAQARDYVAAQGFRAQRITAVENAIDTRELRRQIAGVTEAEKTAARVALGWNAADRVLVCCGSIYPNKFVHELIEASDGMHAAEARVRLLVIGGGIGLPRARELAEARPWVRCVGPQLGRDKALLLSLGELFLNPGVIGLGVLDAFCAGLPVITRRLAVSSPELEYVWHGVNGLVLPTDMDDYARTVVALLHDEAQLARLRSGAHDGAARYSIETMVENFARGVRAILRRRP